MTEDLWIQVIGFHCRPLSSKCLIPGFLGEEKMHTYIHLQACYKFCDIKIYGK